MTTDIPLATLITASVTLAVFTINLFVNSYSAFTKRKNHRMLLDLNQIKFIKEINAQARCYTELKDGLNLDGLDSIVNRQIIKSTRLFFELGYENIFKAYFSGFENLFIKNRKKRIEYFNSFWSQVEFVTETAETFAIQFEKMVADRNQNSKLRSLYTDKILSNLRRFILKFYSDLKPNDDLYSYYQQILKLVMDYEAIKERSLPNISDKFCNEIYEINCSNYGLLHVYESEINSEDVMDACKLYSREFENLKVIISINKEIFEDLATKYSKSGETMSEVHKVLNPRTKIFD